MDILDSSAFGLNNRIFICARHLTKTRIKLFFDFRLTLKIEKLKQLLPFKLKLV